MRHGFGDGRLIETMGWSEPVVANARFVAPGRAYLLESSASIAVVAVQPKSGVATDALTR